MSSYFKTSFRKNKKIDDGDIVIAVMGATGSGKTQFINEVSGSKHAVSDGLRACTTKVSVSKGFNLGGRTIKLLDTPGFNMMDKYDVKGIKTTVKFLEREYKQGAKLHGVIYLHRISDHRTGALSDNSFRVLRKLCGDENLKNVVIVTTMWRDVSEEEGSVREREMNDDDIIFKTCLDHGAKLMRYGDSPESGRAIISTFLSNARITLLIQEELVDRKAEFSDTLVGKEVELIRLEIDRNHEEKKEKLTARYEEDMRKLEDQRREDYLRYNLIDPSENTGVAPHKPLRPDFMADDEHFIAIMGATGSGKSTFVNLLCAHGSDGLPMKVSNNLESCTKDVDMGEFELDGNRVRLIDTPGFDDTDLSDTDILKSIAAFLANQYGLGATLRGVVYLHRISDNRMGGVSRRSFRLFRALCGDQSLKNVIIVTNMWGGVSPQVGRAREIELRTNEKFFKPALDENARMDRHDNTKASAQRIIRSFFPYKRTVLKIQDEVVRLSKKIEDTDAGKEVNQQYQELLEKHKKEMRDLRAELLSVMVERDEKAREELEETKRVWEARMDQISQEVRNLGLGFRQEIQRQAGRYGGLLVSGRLTPSFNSL